MDHGQASATQRCGSLGIKSQSRPHHAAGERWSVDHYLTSWPRQLFPYHFSEVLHPFFNTLLDLDPDARLAAVATHYQELAAAITGDGSGGGTVIGAGAQVRLAAWLTRVGRTCVSSARDLLDGLRAWLPEHVMLYNQARMVTSSELCAWSSACLICAAADL